MKQHLKPYPEYKDSGVPWLGNVPEHWGLCSLGSMTKPRSVRNRADLPLLSVVREKGVILRSSMGEDENHNYIPDDLSNYKVVREGNLAINKMKAWQGSMGIAPCDGIVSPAYYVFDLDIDNREYAHNLLRSRTYVEFFGQASDGVRIGQWDLSLQKMKRIPVAIPSPAEQAAIVRYLDHMDGLIQKYIASKQKLIKLLEEQKQAIINQAVTRGLDPNVRLKPSGVDWLGDVPEHWEEKPAKYYLREVDERSDTGKEELLSVSHITGVTPRSQKNITMFKAESYVNHKICKPNDLVINTMWAWMAAMGISDHMGIISPSYAVYRPLNPHLFLTSYYDHLLRSKPYVSEYICRSTGIRPSRQRLYPEDFLRIPIVMPPVKEQKEIAAYVAKVTHDNGTIVNFAKRQISLIQEYRTSLIADVVTGKVDVRDAAKSLPEELSETGVV